MTLLLRDEAFYNSYGFRSFKYLGDSLNTIRLLNDKNCMEAAILNLDDHLDYSLLGNIANEAFMPLTYGGALSNLRDVAKVISHGYEKIVLKDTPLGLKLAREVSETFGAQAVSICINYGSTKKNGLKKFLPFRTRPQKFLGKTKMLEARLEAALNTNPGELFLQNIDRDGRECGFDLDILDSLKSVTTPVVLSGGSRGLDDIKIVNKINKGIDFAGTTAYCFHNGGMLINYPKMREIYSLKM